MLEIKAINRINKVMGYGATYPIHIVADDSKDYILKTKIRNFDDSGFIPSSKELFTELFSYLYLHTLKIKKPCIPNICLLEVTEETLNLAKKLEKGDERDKAAYENLKISKGLNLGVEFIHNTSKIFSQLNCSQEFKRLAINYDARLMNTDRNKSNPNILENPNGEYWLIDFGLALDMGNLFDNLQSKIGLFGANEDYFDKCCFDDYIFNEIQRKNVKILRQKIDKDSILNLIQKTCQIISLLQENDEQDYLAQIISMREKSKRIFYA